MIAVYVNDMNLIRIFEEFSKTTKYLKELEVKDLSKTKIYLGLEPSIKQMKYLSIS